MAEVVDSIIAELILKSQGYAEGFDAATAAHGRFQKSVDALKGQTFDLSAEAQKYKGGLDQIAGGEESTTQRIVTTRKKRTSEAKAADDAEKASAKEAAAAIKQAEKEKADAAKAAAAERAAVAKAAAKAESDAAKAAQARAKETAEAERQLAVASGQATRQQIENLERLKAAEREAANQSRANAFLTGADNRAGIKRSEVASAFGGGALDRLEAEQVAREAAPVAASEPQRPEIFLPQDRNIRRTGTLSPIGEQDGMQSAIPAAALATDADVAAAKEVDQLGLDILLTADRLKTARGEDRAILAEELDTLRLIGQLQAKGVGDAEIALALSERAARLDAARAADAEKQAATSGGAGKSLLRFGEGAGLGRSFGSTATVAGIATAAGVGAAAEAIKAATDYAKALDDVSKEAGISAEQLQVYQHAATQAGAKSTDFDTGLLHLSDSLGKARTGATEQGKAFAALGVDIKTGASAGDLLPTLIDRISSIQDQSKRAAVEVALFGESGAKLDGLLSGGNQKVNDLAAALERTGAILSSSDIARLDDVSKKLDQVKAQLLVDVSETVANNATSILALAASFEKLIGAIPNALNALGKFDDYLAIGHGGARVALGIATFQPSLVAGGYNEINGAHNDLSARTARSKADDDTTRLNNSLAGVDASASFLHPKTPVQSGGVNQRLLDTLNAPKGPKGPDLQKKADEQEKRYQDEAAQIRQRQLEALRQTLVGTDAQYLIQQAEIVAEGDKRDESYREQAKLKEITEARSKELIAANDAAVLEALRVAALKHQVEAYNATQDAAQQSISLQKELLSNQGAFADSSKKRLALSLQQIDLDEQAARQRAIGTIFSPDPNVTDAQRSAAGTDLRNAGVIAQSQRAAAARENQSPGQEYARSLKFTSDAVQDFGVKELETFNSELDKSVEKALHLHGIFGSIVKDLIDMAVKQGVIKPLAGAFFGGGDSAGGFGGLVGSASKALSGGGGGLLGSIGKLLGLGGGGIDAAGNVAGANSAISSILGNLTIPGFASGGGGTIGGNPGIDQNLLSLNGKPIARVGQGEQLTVSPNIGSANGRVASSGGGVVIQQTNHIDASGVNPDGYTQSILTAVHSATTRAIAQGNRQTLAAAPGQVNYTNKSRG